MVLLSGCLIPMRRNRSASRYYLNLISTLVAIGTVLLSSSNFNSPALAESLSDLNKKKQQLEQQAAAAKQQAAAKQTQAQELQNQLNIVNVRINQTQNAINQTNSQIGQTNANITNLETKIKTEEDNLANEKTKMTNVVSAWYMENQNGLLETLLSASSISDAVDTQTAYDSVRQQIKSAQDRIIQIKNDLANQKNDKEKQLLSLNSLKNDQESEKQSLENNQQTKNRLLNNTNGAIADLKDEQARIQSQITDIESKIKRLTATKIWGTGVVSGSGGLSVPSFYQTGNFARIGNSPYAGININNYGCLITSIAMVATYYGHHTTPDDIAGMSGIFSSGGSMLVNTPPGIGINIQPSQNFNSDVVDDELANGHPVIASIYLPDVGRINADGSSHFIVIKGKSGSQYIMNDPIGDGRGYSTSQLRSMKIIRSY